MARHSKNAMQRAGPSAATDPHPRRRPVTRTQARSTRLSTLGLFMTAAMAGAQAGTVTVVTSFPKEVTQAYKQAFEKANPDIKLEMLNRSTTASVAYVRETPAGQRPDVFWASAPDAFEVLAKNKLLEKAD